MAFREAKRNVGAAVLTCAWPKEAEVNSIPNSGTLPAHLLLEYSQVRCRPIHSMSFLSRSEYDRGVNTFSPEGRLFQVEYAIEAIKLGSTAIGVCTKEGVILVVEKRVTSPLVDPSSIEKLLEIDYHMGCAMSGLTADARTLVDHARVEAQAHWFTYDERMPIESNVNAIADMALDFSDSDKKKKTMSRPFGVALLVAGVDPWDGPVLFNTDPSGTFTKYAACAIGSAQEGATSMLQEQYNKDMTLKEAEILALTTLRQVMEEKLSKVNIEVGVVPTSTGKFRCYNAEELEDVISRLWGCSVDSWNSEILRASRARGCEEHGAGDVNIALLLGDPEARARLRRHLGGSQEAVELGAVAASQLPGLIIVEPADLMGVTEITELATFLRGLQTAHGLILCADGGPPEQLGLLASFYGVSETALGSFAVLCGPGPLASLRQALNHFVDTDSLPAFDAEDPQFAEQLIRLLHQRQPRDCEPLRCDHELLAQYRSIRQQLGTRSVPERRSADLARCSSDPSPSSSHSQDPARSWTVLVFGKTGAGKSHLGNLILGREVFASGDSLASVTSTESVRKATSQDGRLTVLDTIGFGDTRLPPEVVVRSLRDTALEEPKPKDGVKAAKPAEKKDVKKTIDKKDAKDGKAKEEKPKAKIDDKSKAKADKPKPKDEKSKAKADEKPKTKAKVDDKSKPKTEDKSKAKADEKSKPKTDEKSKAKDSKAKGNLWRAKKAPAAAAAAEASERKAAAATAAATDEIEETAPEPEEAKAKPKGACAAEALDVDESEDHGALDFSTAQEGPTTESREAARNEKRHRRDLDLETLFPTLSQLPLPEVDRSQSHDPGEESEPEEAEAEAEDGKEKPKEKGKAKDKTKEKGKDKERGRGKKKKGKTSYSYEEDSGSSDASAARRKKRRANAGLKPASGFGLAPPPAAEAPMSAFSSAPTPMAVLPAPVAGLLTSDVATDLQRMRMAVEAATGKTMEPRLKLDQREEEREQKLSMAEDLRDALLDPSNMKQLLTRTSLLSVTQAEDGKIILRAPSKQSMKVGLLLRNLAAIVREKPEKAIHTVVIRLEGRVNPRSDKLRIGTDARQCQVVVEAIAGISRKHATISFEQEAKPEDPPSRPQEPEFRIGLGSLFPNFDCRTTQGDFRFYEFLEKQAEHGFTMLFSHPKDFTPVCTTEIGACQVLAKDFQRRGVQLIGLSCDSVEQHRKWAEDVLVASRQTAKASQLDFPIIADETREIANLLGMMDPLEIDDFSKLSMPARALFLIGPDKRLRLTILYPATTGRNFGEVLRVIDSLYLTSCAKVGTPANWHRGDDVLLAMNAPPEGLFNVAKEEPVISGKRYMRHLPPPTVRPKQRIPDLGEVPQSDAAFKIKLGAIFPNFDWHATSKGISRFHQLLDRMKGALTLFICWPRNFDAVATTELMCCMQMGADLKKRGVALVGMTCDTVEDQKSWVDDCLVLAGLGGSTEYPTMIPDKSHHIAHELGLLPRGNRDKDTSPARVMFVLDQQKKVRLSMQYPQTIGFNFFEVLRALDALILNKDFELNTPANWQMGDRVIVDPKMSTKQANLRFRNLESVVLPSASWTPPKEDYLRYVDCPARTGPVAQEEVSLPAAPLFGAHVWEPRVIQESVWFGRKCDIAACRPSSTVRAQPTSGTNVYMKT
ncbi:Psma5 [Symbiodinium sp. KB8]|nr:Psma5 [Symbiodinium sp. KB8]